MIYTTSQVQKQFSILLKKTRDGQIFVISPVRAHTAKKSPFEVRSIKLPITRADILQSIRDSRERY
jgi:hypothetical protein